MLKQVLDVYFLLSKINDDKLVIFTSLV